MGRNTKKVPNFNLTLLLTLHILGLIPIIGWFALVLISCFLIMYPFPNPSRVVKPYLDGTYEIEHVFDESLPLKKRLEAAEYFIYAWDYISDSREMLDAIYDEYYKMLLQLYDKYAKEWEIVK